jgi:hypothetical protein
MPFCATIPKADRSSALSLLYHGRDCSSCRMVVVESCPTLARSFFRVSDFSGVTLGWDGFRFAGWVDGAGIL